MPYPQHWMVSAQPSAGLFGLGLTVGGALCRVPNIAASIAMPALMHSGSLFVGACNTTAVLTHTGMLLGANGTYRTLISLNWFANIGTNGFRTGIFCQRGTASAGGDDTYSGPCYAFTAGPANQATYPNQSTWLLEKYPSGVSGTALQLLASTVAHLSAQAGLVFSVQLSWMASASGVQLVAMAALGVVSQFASYASLANSISITYLDSASPLTAASGAGLWVRDTQNGLLAVFDMTCGSAGG